MAKIIDCLAHNLPLIRKQKGLSQDELAKRVGVTRGTIAKYETAVGGATLDTISRLADALGCEETFLTNDPIYLNKAVFFSESNTPDIGVNLNIDEKSIRTALSVALDGMFNSRQRALLLSESEKTRAEMSPAEIRSILKDLHATIGDVEKPGILAAIIVELRRLHESQRLQRVQIQADQKERQNQAIRSIGSSFQQQADRMKTTNCTTQPNGIGGFRTSCN